MIGSPGVGAVVIGRNEGARLVRCLASLQGAVDRIIYVDLGSTDGSAEAARTAGAEVIDLDVSHPFTAARARNAGFAALASGGAPEFVQFVDGDCEMRAGWINAAAAFLVEHPKVATVSGRLRERHPEASVYNRLCDREWYTPPGQVLACLGITMIRSDALNLVGGFDPRLIAGEEPELCVRLRAKGWDIWRLPDEMAQHDAAMTRFSQWWKRQRRSGHAYAEGAAMHGSPPEYHFVANQRRALIWGLALPLVTICGALLSGWALLLLLVWPAQVIRLAARNSFAAGAWENAVFLTLGKIPETLGILEYRTRRLLRRPTGLIEYK